MKGYSSLEVTKILTKEGWYLVGVRGGHHHFRHPNKPGKVQVPHPRKDLKPKTARSILK